MRTQIRNITVDSAQPYALAQFWSQVLDRPIDADSAPGDDEVAVPLEDGLDLLFLAVPDIKSVKNRLHLCLQPEQARDRDVERILALGATMFDDLRQDDGSGWAVLADPEGNEFCVLRSEAERVPPLS